MNDRSASVATTSASPISSALEWLSRLVEVDTVSSKSNLGLIELVRDDLVRLGLRPVLSYNPEKNKANLFVTLATARGETQGGLVLSGHTDVVPVEGQSWTVAPFKATMQDGRIIGRGSADMKGFIATVLALIPQFQHIPLAQPLHIALTYDEEVGCFGALTLLEDLRRRGVHPEGCIIGEPSGMQPVIAHKGINHFHCHLLGREAHSSLTHKGVNSIEYAAKLIVHLRELADDIKINGPFNQDFKIPYSTMQTGLIKGGSAINTVPNHCEFKFEFRNLPQVPAEDIRERVLRRAQELEQEMRRVDPACHIHIHQLCCPPALDMPADHALVSRVRRLIANPEPSKESYGTEAGYYVQGGIPTVVLGPGHITEAHRPDEFIEVSQLEKCHDFLKKLAQTMTESHAR